ncbi:unnamed protein product [Lupinus luteus]|uniref:Uncharacterized protein n=1 Tax=Lupinus luteus TaxID=3873 RepID=A0AAV1W237_LUPLU
MCSICLLKCCYCFHKLVFPVLKSMARPFELISDLNDSKHLWKIAVRIIDIWYVQLPPKPGHLQMILMNSKEITCATIGTTTMFIVGK